MIPRQKLDILVVDDEPLARTRIINLLNQVSDVRTIDECRNGAEAIQSIKDQKPDLVFLDIQMPDKTGFDVIRSLNSNQMPLVIFVTAYDSYAIKAFDVSAVDYLLKPFEDHRFFEAYEKALGYATFKKGAEFNKKLTNLIDVFFNEKEDYIFQIKQDGWINKVPHHEVSHIEALGNYVKLYVQGKFHLDRSSLSSIEHRLRNTTFFRIHRSYLVNKSFIEKVIYKGNNEYRVRLSTGETIISGRGYKENIVKYLEHVD